MEQLLKEIIGEAKRSNISNDRSPVNESIDSMSYGSLRDLREKRMSIERESPQFGPSSSSREGFIYSSMLKFQQLNHNQDELEHANPSNLVAMKMFQKQNSIYSFNKTENSSQNNSETTPEKTAQEACKHSDETYRSPNFLEPGGHMIKHQDSLPVDQKRSMSLVHRSSPFKNQLSQIAEMVKLQNSNKTFEPSPKIGSFGKRQSAFVQKSHLSISSIYTMNSVSNDEPAPSSSNSVKLNSLVTNRLKSQMQEQLSSLKQNSSSKQFYTESK